MLFTGITIRLGCYNREQGDQTHIVSQQTYSIYLLIVNKIEFYLSINYHNINTLLIYCGDTNSH